MLIGIVSATPFEIEPVTRFIQQRGTSSPHQVQILITGVGMLSTTYHLSEQLHQQPFDLLLQAGICGAFPGALSLADTVLVGEETLGDLGVEEQSFKDVFDMGFAQADQFPFTAKKLVNPDMDRWHHLGLQVVRGLTINEISTRPGRIILLQQKYGCNVESMEGAAFHYVCLQCGIPFLQLRSVSNMVGERNKSNWKIKAAIENLNHQLIRILEQITIR